MCAGGKVWLLGNNGKVTARLEVWRTQPDITDFFFSLQNFINRNAFMKRCLEGKVK